MRKTAFAQPPVTRLGFTLLELIIVLIIVTILVSLGLPLYDRLLEKGRWVEVVNILGAIRKAQWAYYQEHGVYTNSLQDLGMGELPCAYCDPAYYFRCCANTCPTCPSPVIVAICARCREGQGGKPPGVSWSGFYSFVIDENGNISTAVGQIP